MKKQFVSYTFLIFEKNKYEGKNTLKTCYSLIFLKGHYILRFKCPVQSLLHDVNCALFNHCDFQGQFNVDSPRMRGTVSVQEVVTEVLHYCTVLYCTVLYCILSIKMFFHTSLMPFFLGDKNTKPDPTLQQTEDKLCVRQQITGLYSTLILCTVIMSCTTS